MEADPLVELVRRKADELRATGVVPADVEARLDEHAAVVASGAESIGARLRAAVDAIPLSSARHALALPLRRAGAGTDSLAAAVRHALGMVADALDSPGSHGHADLQRSVDHLLDRVAQIDRLPEGTDSLADLRRRVETLEAAVRLLAESHGGG